MHGAWRADVGRGRGVPFEGSARSWVLVRLDSPGVVPAHQVKGGGGYNILARMTRHAQSGHRMLDKRSSRKDGMGEAE